MSLVLAHLFSFLPFVRVAPETVAVLARQISLALVGAIILSSIRRVLQGVARVRAPVCVCRSGVDALSDSSCLGRYCA